MPSGRSGTGHRVYRRNRVLLLSTNDICALCGHPGALTADHIVSDPDWPRDEHGRRLPGFDELTNLQPAHGTMGNRPPHNPCPTCQRLCNQHKGSGQHTPRTITPPARRSRNWYTTTEGEP